MRPPARSVDDPQRLGPGEARFMPSGGWHPVRARAIRRPVSMTHFGFPDNFDGSESGYR